MIERAAPRRPQLGDEQVLPDPVQAQRHQIVHQVIAAGDFMKDIVDQPLLGVDSDFARAEMGLMGFAGHEALHGAPAFIALARSAGQFRSMRRARERTFRGPAKIANQRFGKRARAARRRSMR